MMYKLCRTCNQEKPVTEFRKASEGKGCKLGLRSACKACTSVKEKAYRESRREHYSEIKKKYYWRNRDAIRERMRKTAKEKYPERRVKIVARRALMKEQTPVWADIVKMRQIYERASQLRALGLNVHVDHIVPLISDSVCGFHCEDNLEIIYAEDNISKSNKWWPEDFNHQHLKGVYK